MEENLQQLEATYGAPASLFERSAAARAKAAGSTAEAVVAQWIGEDAPPAGGSAAGGSAAGESPVEDAPSSATSGLTGAALLAAVAEARGMPDSLIERSAKARAGATGGSVEGVLQEWAAEEGLGEAESPVAGRRSPVEAEESPIEGAPTPSSGALSGAALLAAVAEARGMPESLIQRSATARAKTAGVDVDDVLRDWAEEEGLDVGGPGSPVGKPESAPVPPAEGRGDAEERSDDAGGQVSASGALTGAALLSAVAAARKMPESLVERSAKARAKREGGSVEGVLLEWAAEEGLELSPAAGARSPVEEPSVPALETAGFVPATDQPEDLDEVSDATVRDTGPPPRAEIPSPPEIEPVEESEPEEPESPRIRYPAWLAAVLVVIPLLALLYLIVVPNQPTCGSAGQLAIDPATGVAVACDGGEYGVDEVSNFSIGATVYEAACAACHGADGGGGAGPAMAGGAVLEAFPETACESQIEWVVLGSSNWPDATFGANNKPVAGGMPGFESQLTELEIAQVVLFERVEFGGLDLETAEPACGFITEEEG